MWNRPSVRMYSGIEMIWTIGLMIAFTSPKITATTRMIPTRCRVVSPPTKRTPETTRVTIHSASPVTAARRRNATMAPILPWQARLRAAQQVGVHDPAVPGARLRAQLDDLLADVTDGA